MSFGHPSLHSSRVLLCLDMAHIKPKAQMQETKLIRPYGLKVVSSPDSSAAGCSWVVEIERYIGSGMAGAMVRGSKPGHSIYRVPEYIKNMTNPNAYRPQLVSLGPFHHGDPALMPMEKHKGRAVANLVNRSGKPLQVFIAAVEEMKEQLQDAYENLDDKWRQGTRFVELMLKDGCFLLEMAWVYDGRVEDYEPDDPVFSEHGCLYLFAGTTSPPPAEFIFPTYFRYPWA